MEDGCWKCKSVLHHGQECTKKDTDVRAKRDIQEYRDKITHPSQSAAKKAVQLNKYMQKMAVYESVPPFCLVKNEVNRLTDFYQEITQAVDDLPVDCGTDVGEMKERLLEVTELKNRFSIENASVREIRVTHKVVGQKWEWVDEEVELLFTRMEDVGLLQTQLSDILYKKKSRFTSAVSFLEFWHQAKSDVSNFVTTGLDVYNGRPLKIPDVKRDWAALKDMRKKMQEAMHKFHYLFSEESWNNLNTDMQLLIENWKLLKQCKDSYERQPARDLCKVCYDANVNFTLPCGHVYCGSCLAALIECGFCRGPCYPVIELHFD